VRDLLTPVVAAASSMIIARTAGGLLVAARITGVRRLVEQR